MAATEENIEFDAEGEIEIGEPEVVSTAPPAKPEPSTEDESRGDRAARIFEMIENPETAIAVVLRQIAVEMADIMRRMNAPGLDPLKATSQKDLAEQMKSWQVLQKTLTESDELSRKDVLNLDGPKFKHVLVTLMKFFEQALGDGGVEEGQARNIMLQFANMVKVNDEAMRRELSKIEIGRVG